jgi:hypothetical protein
MRALALDLVRREQQRRQDQQQQQEQQQQQQEQQQEHEQEQQGHEQRREQAQEAAGAETEPAPIPSGWALGFHSVPSLLRLHLHVISTDMDSPALKNKVRQSGCTEMHAALP